MSDDLRERVIQARARFMLHERNWNSVEYARRAGYVLNVFSPDSKIDYGLLELWNYVMEHHFETTYEFDNILLAFDLMEKYAKNWVFA